MSADDQQAYEVPLVEQLRSIPKEYRTCRAIQWSDDGRETGHQLIPVGFMMHRAADMIEALQSATPRSEPANARAVALEEAAQIAHTYRGVGDAAAPIEDAIRALAALPEAPQPE